MQGRHAGAYFGALSHQVCVQITLAGPLLNFYSEEHKKNKLDGIMIKHWMLPLALLMMTSPAMAVQSGSASNDALMKEVRAMRNEIKDLKQTVEQMETLINALAAHQLKEGNLPLATVEVNCQGRIDELERKLNQFTTLGYTAGHPDVRGVAAQIESLRKQCVTENR